MKVMLFCSSLLAAAIKLTFGSWVESRTLVRRNSFAVNPLKAGDQMEVLPISASLCRRIIVRTTDLTRPDYVVRLRLNLGMLAI